MKRSVRRGFLVRLGLAAGSAALFVVTLVWHDWIEIVFRVDPDRGNGWLEWLVVLVAFGLTLIFSISARQEWRRSTSATAVGDSAS
jgi:apolipoprotein N-acyltransferase